MPATSSRSVDPIGMPWGDAHPPGRRGDRGRGAHGRRPDRPARGEGDGAVAGRGIVIPARVQAVLDAHGLEALEFEPGSTPTAELAAERIGVAVGQIAKSILLKGKDGSFTLVVAAGDRRLDNRRLKAALGVKTRMATADETEAVTGFRPGAVCPFGLDGVEVLVDRSLERYEVVYPAAGTDASGVPMSFEQLVAITGGRLCAVT